MSDTAKQYHSIRHRLFIIDLLLTFIILLSVQLSGVSTLLYSYINGWHPNYYIANGIYVVCFFALMAILSLPLNLYRGYFLEHRFDLSNQSIGSWIWDGIKGFLLNTLFGVIAIETIYSFLRNFPQIWWILATLFYLFFSIFLSRITPTLILPLFYKLKNIDRKGLEDKLKDLAQKVNAELLGIYEMDMSRKTKKANAMFTGWGRTRRIILGDTLLEKFSDDEIEVILAHEMGHYYYRHIWKLVTLSIISTLAGFFIVSKILIISYSSLGLSGIDDISGLPFFMLILFVFFLILMPVQNGFSRILERQADRFALEKTNKIDDFISAMEKLASQNLSDEDPHPFIEFMLHSHPSVKKRVQMAEQYR